MILFLARSIQLYISYMEQGILGVDARARLICMMMEIDTQCLLLTRYRVGGLVSKVHKTHDASIHFRCLILATQDLAYTETNLNICRFDKSGV